LQYGFKNSDAGPLRCSDCSGKFSRPESGEKIIRTLSARIGPIRGYSL
jgi:hypothetical protein